MHTRSIAGRAVAVAGLLVSALTVPAVTGAAGASTDNCAPGIVELPGIGTGDAEAGAFNGGGTVVGNAAETPDGPPRPVVWTDRNPTVVPLAPGMVGGGAADVNARGEVVGNMFDAGRNLHAYHWDGHRVVLLAGLGGSYTYARRINAQGQIAGAGADPDGNEYALRWSSYRAAPEVLAPRPPDNFSFSKGINDAGVVGGDSDLVTTDTFRVHAALWDRAGNIRVLDGIGGPGVEGEIFEVNNAGQAAGDSANTNDYADPRYFIHAALWQPDGAVHDIGTLPGDTHSMALGLSAAGYVAGGSDQTDYSTGEPGLIRAFVWPGHGTPLALPVPHGAWTATFSIAHQIDDRGTVAGTYQPPGEPAHAILWTCAFAQAFQPAGTTRAAAGARPTHDATTAQGVHRLLTHGAASKTPALGRR